MIVTYISQIFSSIFRNQFEYLGTTFTTAMSVPRTMPIKNAEKAIIRVLPNPDKSCIWYFANTLAKFSKKLSHIFYAPRPLV